MADVYTVFGTLLALGIAFPGMLLAYRLLFPKFVGRAQARVARGAGGAFGIGLLGGLMLAVPVTVLLAVPFSPAQFFGASLLLFALAFASLGAAGVAGAMGAAYREADGDEISPTGAFVRGAVALELAAAFPFLGWFLVIPVMIFVSLGASVGALLGRRSAAPSPMAEGGLLHEPQSA